MTPNAPSGSGESVLEPIDLDLWKAAVHGDHGAFHTLVDRHARGLFRVAVSLSASRSDAEDICQETFAAAFKGLKGFDGRASIKTWLTRILMRRAAVLDLRKPILEPGAAAAMGNRMAGESECICGARG